MKATTGAKHQELDISFTFDEQCPDRLIINAMVNHVPYHHEVFSHLDIDFEDIKNALLTKQFKLVSKTSEILKLKIAFATFEFKNIEKITLSSMKQTIAQMNDKLREQYQKNNLLEGVIKQLKNEFNSMTTKIDDLRRINNEQIIMMKRSELELIKKVQEERLQKNKFEKAQKLLRARVEKLQSQKSQQEQKHYRSLRFQEEKIQKLYEKKSRQHEQRILRIEKESLQKSRQKDSAQKNQLKLLEERIEKVQKEKADKLRSEMLKTFEEEKAKQLEKKLQQDKLQRLQTLQKKKLEKKEVKKMKKMKQEEQKHLKQERFKEIEYQRICKISENRGLKLQLDNPNALKLMKEMIKIQNAQYKFSSKFKYEQIQLKNNRIKDPTFSLDGGIAIVEGIVFEKGSSIKIKVQSIGECVGVGLGVRNVIACNEFRIKRWDAVGNGCFLLFNDNESFIHSDDIHKWIPTDFKYHKGDVIEVKTNGDELCFINEKSQKEFNLKIKLTEEEWNQACFCAYLRSSKIVSSVSVVH